MKTAATMLGVVSCVALSGCSPSAADKIDANLNCSALISAASFLASSGKVENDPAFAKRALVSSMTYLTAYAIPRRLKEAAAFEEVKSLRASLMETRQPDEIMTLARTCIDSSPL